MAMKKRTKKRISFILITIFLIMLMCAAICTATIAVYINKYLRSEIDIDLKSYRLNLTSFIYTLDEEGREVLQDTLHGDENRVWVNLDEIPRDLQIAFVSIEDSRFYLHHGVDWKRTIGAAVNYFIPFRANFGGGSTITQQLIKNLTGEDETSVKRKIREIISATQVEENYDKDEILELYLNTIFLGRGVYGVSQAARTYFDKDLSELTLGECAAIAGITKNPYKYDLIRFPEYNAERRAVVLRMMLENGNISEAQYNDAVAEEIVAVRTSDKSSDYSYNSYFTDALIDQLITDLQEEKGYSRAFASRLIYGGGLKIVSTQDPEIQVKMDEVFLDEEHFPGSMGSDGNYPQAAMVLMDPYTGQVKALYGGRGQKEGSRVLNRATGTTRQPGSGIKPITVYAPAIEEGIITPISVIDDAPKDFNVRSTGWPRNENRTYSGLCTIYRGIGSSLNTVAVDLIQKLGYQKSFDFATQNMGLSTLIEKQVITNSDGSKSVKSDLDASPLALGGLTKGVTVLDMTAAYCTFVNDGVYNKPIFYTAVYDSDGKLLIDNSPEPKEAMSQKTRDYMIQLLRYVVTSGTGRSASLGNIEAGGKTGTTSADNDRWFAGITPYYAGVVWFGFDKPQSLEKFSTNPALQLWTNVMKKVHKDLPARKFELKTPMVEVTYCQDSGLLATDLCKNDIRGNRALTARVTEEDAPTEYCNTHVAVLLDSKTGQLATNTCPTENVKTVGALNLRRLYPYYGVKVGDQQYCAPYYVRQEELDEGLYKSASLTLQYCTAHPGDALLEMPKEPTPDEPPAPHDPHTPDVTPPPVVDTPPTQPHDPDED